MTSSSIRVQRAVTARETWVVVLVVLLCVAVPTALAMGFLWRAMDQERAARQAQEGELRRLRLLDAQGALDAWIERIATLRPLDLQGLAPAAAFAKAAVSSLCDSVIVLREGQPVYPCRSLPLEDSAMTDEDRVGQELLRRGGAASDCPPSARAASGRLIRPMLLLRAATTDTAAREELQGLIADYEKPVPLATAQRLFLAQELVMAAEASGRTGAGLAGASPARAGACGAFTRAGCGGCVAGAEPGSLTVGAAVRGAGAGATARWRGGGAACGGLAGASGARGSSGSG